MHILKHFFLFIFQVDLDADHGDSATGLYNKHYMKETWAQTSVVHGPLHRE